MFPGQRQIESNSMRNSLIIKNLSFKYEESHNLIFDKIDIVISKGEFVCILGPSGCGKSTLLNIIAGFIKHQHGSIERADKVSMVFQKNNLFPWKTALKNITLALSAQGLNQEESCKKARHYLKQVDLEGHQHKYPFQLSLGMQQRVGIARAFSQESELLLMDEPFGSLDAQTRYKMQQLLLEIRKKELVTIVFVTHDIDEAILLADRIILLSNSSGTIKEEIVINKKKEIEGPVIMDRSQFIEIRNKIFKLLI